MVVTQEMMDELTAKAKENPRLRCNLNMKERGGRVPVPQQ